MLYVYVKGVKKGGGVKEVEGREGSEEGERKGKVKEEKGTLGLTLTLTKVKKKCFAHSVTGAVQSLFSHLHLTLSLTHSLTCTHISYFPKSG